MYIIWIDRFSCINTFTLNIFGDKKEKVMKNKGKPKPGVVYSLTGGPGTPSIANGNTWAESEVKDELIRQQTDPRHNQNGTLFADAIDKHLIMKKGIVK